MISVIMNIHSGRIGFAIKHSERGKTHKMYLLREKYVRELMAHLTDCLMKLENLKDEREEVEQETMEEEVSYPELRTMTNPYETVYCLVE